MKIDIIISADDIKKEKIENKNVVVIDMLRATSVIVTAINNGCEEVIPVLEVEDALNIASKDKDMFRLGGERNALKIDGFHFSNSPLDYTRETIKGKKLVITTSNGTRAINRALSAKHIYIGAMINAKSIANKLIEEGQDVVFINAGTAGQFSMDDFICAGYMINLIKEQRNLELTDIAFTSLYIYNENRNIESFIKNACHFKRIKELGLEEDLKYCMKKDIIDVVPEYTDGSIK